MKIFKLTTLIIFAILAACTTNVENTGVVADTTLTHGPEKGSLVIVGGGRLDSVIINRFIALSGGLDAPMVIIPTASEAETIDEERTASFLTSAGATNVTVLHTRDPQVANQEEFIEPLKTASGVWFGGGRQWRIVDAYGGTIAEKEIRAVLDRGGVIGGSSAGATIQGSYLARGDTSGNTIMMGSHQEGFNYLTNCAIDQHLLVRNRQHDLVEIISEYPHLLGIGLDESTAVVVTGDELEVIGKSFVAIFDYNHWSENPNCTQPIPNGGKFFFLRSGDRYNVNTREVLDWGRGNSRNIFRQPSAEGQ